jgi:hypothetical protein
VVLCGFLQYVIRQRNQVSPPRNQLLNQFNLRWSPNSCTLTMRHPAHNNQGDPGARTDQEGRGGRELLPSIPMELLARLPYRHGYPFLNIAGVRRRLQLIAVTHFSCRGRLAAGTVRLCSLRSLWLREAGKAAAALTVSLSRTTADLVLAAASFVRTLPSSSSPASRRRWSSAPSSDPSPTNSAWLPLARAHSARALAPLSFMKLPTSP